MLSSVPTAGIDVGKDFLDLGFHPAAKPLRCDNTPAGIRDLIAAVTSRGVQRVALEAIGPYAYPACPWVWSIRAGSGPSARPRG